MEEGYEREKGGESDSGGRVREKERGGERGDSGGMYV